MAFTSNDRRHRRTVPLFLQADQSYVPADELKLALAELDQHYDALPEENKELGVMQFASYLPSDLDNVVSRLEVEEAGKETPADTGSSAAET